MPGPEGYTAEDFRKMRPWYEGDPTSAYPMDVRRTNERITHDVMGCRACRTMTEYERKEGFRTTAMRCPNCGNWLIFYSPFEAALRRDENPEAFEGCPW